MDLESSQEGNTDVLFPPGYSIQDPTTEDDDRAQTKRQKPASLSSGKKYLFGLVLVCLIACSWVGSTQTAKSAYTGDFKAPFFSMWFSTAWMISLFPLAAPLYFVTKEKSLNGLWRLVFRSITIIAIPSDAIM